MFGGTEIEYVKVGKKSVLVLNIASVDRAVPAIGDAEPAARRASLLVRIR